METPGRLSREILTTEALCLVMRGSWLASGSLG